MTDTLSILGPAAQKAVAHLGFKSLTEIQSQAIPLAMEGKDLIAQSATGSGKTAAFGLPLISQLTPKRCVQALVLTPTRELCVQVYEALASFAKFTSLQVGAVYGGVGYEGQKIALRKCDIIVATPGRILDHLERKVFDPSHVSHLILDEADRMLDMGFYEDIVRIIQSVPTQRQTLLFSATMPREIEQLAFKHMKQPVRITSSTHVDRSKLKQVYYDVDRKEKFSLLIHLLKEMPKGLTLIFCSTRREVDVVTQNLKKSDIKCMAIHGGLSQNRRSHALEQLKLSRIHVLVATDVAARGIDVKDVACVINYDVAKTADEHTHRVGRTARAGTSGIAITLLVERDHGLFAQVLRDKHNVITQEKTPTLERVAFVRDIEPRRENSRFSRGPRRDFGRSSRGSFGSRDSYGESSGSGESSDRPPRRSFDGEGSRGPRREFSRDRPPRRSFNRDDSSGEKREFSSGRPQFGRRNNPQVYRRS
jgi:ATP-dependent RNA helicase DeaD